MSDPIDWPHAPPHRLGSNHPYIVTAATFHKEHFFRTRQRLDVLQRGILKVAAEFEWRLEAWAAFSNHYHFIARPPRTEDAGSLRTMISKLHTKMAAWVNKLDASRGRKVWFNYRETILSFEKSYFARLNYVHRNAVHHGLVLKAEDYPWCSARWFRQNAERSFVRTIESFRTDRVKVEDEFQPEMPEVDSQGGGSSNPGDHE